MQQKQERVFFSDGLSFYYHAYVPGSNPVSQLISKLSAVDGWQVPSQAKTKPTILGLDVRASLVVGAFRTYTLIKKEQIGLSPSSSPKL